MVTRINQTVPTYYIDDPPLEEPKQPEKMIPKSQELHNKKYKECPPAPPNSPVTPK